MPYAGERKLFGGFMTALKAGSVGRYAAKTTENHLFGGKSPVDGREGGGIERTHDHTSWTKMLELWYA